MLRQILDQKALHLRMKITAPICYMSFLGNEVCSILNGFLCFLIRDVLCSVYYLMQYRVILFYVTVIFPPTGAAGHGCR